MKPTGRFRLEAEGPYSLSASIRFLEGFVPASYGRQDDADEGGRDDADDDSGDDD